MVLERLHPHRHLRYPRHLRRLGKDPLHDPQLPIRLRQRGPARTPVIEDERALIHLGEEPGSHHTVGAAPRGGDGVWRGVECGQWERSAAAIGAGAAGEEDRVHAALEDHLKTSRERRESIVSMAPCVAKCRTGTVVAPGAKVFEQFFCEAFLNPGDGCLVFSPYFPTYVPNILRRNARPVYASLKQSNEFRPLVSDIENFLNTDPSPKAIMLNSPQNPTGGVTTQEDLRAIADLVRGKNVAVFVDVANIFYAAKAAGVDIDYVTLLKTCSAGRDLVRGEQVDPAGHAPRLDRRPGRRLRRPRSGARRPTSPRGGTGAGPGPRGAGRSRRPARGSRGR